MVKAAPFWGVRIQNRDSKALCPSRCIAPADLWRLVASFARKLVRNKGIGNLATSLQADNTNPKIVFLIGEDCHDEKREQQRRPETLGVRDRDRHQAELSRVQVLCQSN